MATGKPILTHCRYCVNSTLHPSRPKGVRDWICRVMGRKPMRCHNCGKRFYLPAGHVQQSETAPTRPAG